jgi:hypothetical protein
LNILLYFFNYYIGWLVRIGGSKNTDFISKLEASVLQSSNDFVGFFPKDWDVSAIMMFAVASLIILDRG